MSKFWDKLIQSHGLPEVPTPSPQESAGAEGLGQLQPGYRPTYGLPLVDADGTPFSMPNTGLRGGPPIENLSTFYIAVTWSEADAQTQAETEFTCEDVTFYVSRSGQGPLTAGISVSAGTPVRVGTTAVWRVPINVTFPRINLTIRISPEIRRGALPATSTRAESLPSPTREFFLRLPTQPSVSIDPSFSRGTLTVNANWNLNVGTTQFTLDDVTITSSRSATTISGITLSNTVGGTQGKDFTITASLSTTDAAASETITITIRAGAIPQTSTRFASQMQVRCLTVTVAENPGFTPSLGTAVADFDGTALPTTADGTTGNPILSGVFYIPITWPREARQDATTGSDRFRSDDLSVCFNAVGITNPGFSFFRLVEAGTTAVWYAEFERHVGVNSTPSAVDGTITITVIEGALAGSSDRYPSNSVSRTYAYRWKTNAPTVCVSGVSVTGSTLTFTATWSEDVGAGVFTTDDLTIPLVGNISGAIDSVTPVTANTYTAFTVTATLYGSDTVVLRTVIRANAIPETDTRLGSEESIGNLGSLTINAALRAVTPTLSVVALADAAGTALPTTNDGETGEPIVQRNTFAVEVTWPEFLENQNHDALYFDSDDVSVCLTITGATGSVSDGTPVRVGSTLTWRIPITVSRRGNIGGLGTVGITIRAGALPQRRSWAASSQASQNYAFRLQASAPTVCIGQASLTATTLTFNATWNVDVGSGNFTTDDITVTSDNSAVTVAVDTVTPVTANDFTAFLVSATVTGTGTYTLTATVAAGAIPATDTVEASAETSTVIGLFNRYAEGDLITPTATTGLGDLDHNQQPIAGDSAGQFYVIDESNGHRIVRYDVTGSSATPTTLTIRGNVSGRQVGSYRNSAYWIGTNRDVVWKISNTGTNEGSAGLGVGAKGETATATDTRIYVTQSRSANRIGTRIYSYTISSFRSGGNLCRQDSEQINLVDPVTRTSQPILPILITDGTRIWVTDIGNYEPLNRRYRTATLYAYNISTRMRDSANDITYTNNVGIKGITSDGTDHIYIILNNNQIQEFTFRGTQSGFTPTIGAALADADGNTLPTDADGDTGEPIKQRLTFYVPVTWTETAAQTQAATEFNSSDVFGCATITGGMASVCAGTVARVGTTGVWRVPIIVSRVGNTGGTGTITVTVRAAALGANPSAQRGASLSASRTYAFQLQAAPPTATIGNLTQSAGSISFPVQWSQNVGTAFTSSDILLTSSGTGTVSISGLAVAADADGTTGVDFIVSANVTGSGTVSIRATISAGAIPGTDTQEASAQTSRLIGNVVFRTAGYTPTFGKALADAQGTALPARNDGDPNNPIVRRTQFWVPITWTEADAQTAAANQFCQDDVSGTASFPGGALAATATVATGTPARVGTTAVWRVPVTVTRTSNHGGLGSVTISVRAGALDQTSTRNASQAASQAYDFQMQSPAPTATIGAGTLTGQTLTFPVDWSVGIGTEFTTADISLTSSNASVTISGVTVSNRTGGTTGEDFTVTATLSSTAATEITATIAAGAIPESDSREGSALTTGSVGTFGTLDPGYTPTIGDWKPTATGATSTATITRSLEFYVDIDWPAAVTGFANDDVNITSDITGVQGSASIANRIGATANQGFLAHVELSSSRTTSATAMITLTIRAGAVPAAGNRAASLVASKIFSVLIQEPGITITVGMSSLSGNIIEFPITFSENITVSDFTSADATITASNSAITVGAVSVTRTTSGANTTGWTVSAPLRGSGNSTFSLTIPEGAIPQTDTKAGSAAASHTTPSYNVTGTVAPTALRSVTWLAPSLETQTGEFTVEGEWNNTVTDFEETDIQVCGGTKGDFNFPKTMDAGDENIFTLVVTPTANQSGLVRIYISCNAVDEGNGFQEYLVPYDTREEVVEATKPYVVQWDVPDETITTANEMIEVLLTTDRLVQKTDGTDLDSSVLKLEGITGIPEGSIGVDKITDATSDADAVKLRVYCLPTITIANGSSFSFRVVVTGCPLTVSWTTGAISVSAGTVTSVDNTRPGIEAQFTVTTPASGSGTITITALATAYTNLTANLQIGTVNYGG